MIKITRASIARGYTGADHLISPADDARVTALVGTLHANKGAAAKAAEHAFVDHCDPRVRLAKVEITTAKA